MGVAHDTGRRHGPSLRRNAGRLVVLAVLLACWQGLTVLVGAGVLPGPGASVRVAADGLVGEGWLVSSLANTLVALLGAFLVAAVFGGAIGVALGSSEWMRSVFEPFVLNVYAVPKIILYPIFLLVLQFGIDQKIAFGAFHGLFPMAIILTGAVREIPDIHRDVARSLCLSRFQTVRYVVLPSILAPLVVGLRFAFNLSFLGIILSELFAARSGVGLVLRNALSSVDRPRIMGVTLVIVGIALVVNFLFYGLQQYLESRGGLSVDEGGL